MVCLIKPQFEAGREKVGKKGVVRDAAVHREVLANVLSFCEENGFLILALDFSPIKGPEGNIEYLVHIRKDSQNKQEGNVDHDAVVLRAHEILS